MGAPGRILCDPETSKVTFGALGGGPGGTGSTSGALQGGSRTPKPRFWSFACFSRSAPDLIIIVVSAIFKKKIVFFEIGTCGTSRGGQRGSREVHLAPLRPPKGAIGKVDQVHGGPFLRPLDRQKMSGASILREILDGF